MNKSILMASAITAGTLALYYILKRKKHVPMITQFLNSYNPRYKEIIEFIRKEK